MSGEEVSESLPETENEKDSPGNAGAGENIVALKSAKILNKMKPNNKRSDDENNFIEDEETPSFMSISIMSKQDDSADNAKEEVACERGNVNNETKTAELCNETPASPDNSEEQGRNGDCILLSSSEESDNLPDDMDDDDRSEDMDDQEMDNDMSDDDEEEEEDEDEDMRLRYLQDDCRYLEENEHSKHRGPDRTDRSSRTYDDEDELDYETDEMEQFDRASDDCILRPMKSEFTRKQRSNSLQDLSFKNRSFKKSVLNKSPFRSSSDNIEHDDSGYPHNSAVFQSGPNSKKLFAHSKKYDHVESRVKLYIEDIKEQSRRSLERRMKERSTELIENTDGISLKPVVNNHVTKIPLKTYVEETLKDLEVEEKMKPNGKKSEPIELIMDDDNQMEVEIETKQLPKSSKPNGVEGQKLANGCLTYEDYMNGIQTSQKGNLVEIHKKEDSEIAFLQAQLGQRNVQFAEIQKAYQKTLMENLAMKSELENLKKELEMVKKEKPVFEMKHIQVQTDIEAKVSVSSMTSLDLTDNAFSPTISLKPPNVTHLINSDASSIEDATPPKVPSKTLSSAFITSSRILQTLATLTQGTNSQDSANVNPKKRKAVENLTDQPNKIPHTGSSRRHDFINSQRNSETEEKEEDEEEEEGNDEAESKLKCFVYPESDGSKNRSFLIQADDSMRISNKASVKECGPYMLGNIEIRMSEMNGTISIWGKEIDESKEAESNSKCEGQTSNCDKKKPQLICSTNKQPKTLPPRFSGSFNPFSCKYSKPENSETRHRSYSCASDILLDEDQRDDEVFNRKNLFCEHMNDSIHSLHHKCEEVRVENCCNCHVPYQKQQHCHNSCCNPSTSIGAARNCRNFNLSKCNRRANCGNIIDEKISLNHCEQCCCNGHHEKLQNHKDHTLSGIKIEKRFSRGHIDSCSGLQSGRSSPVMEDEEEPLIGSKKNLETPEVKRRRLSGKRVRGILMDLLKGCGDCRNPNVTTSVKKLPTVLQEKQKPPANSARIPDIKITNPTPPERGNTSNRVQPAERCCEACSRRVEMASEVENQLGIFRAEVERLRSRSDALLDMLNVLHATESTN